MREIKFRAWDVEMAIMLSWDEMQHEVEIQELNIFNILRGDHWIPMQFTGLHDLNGKEIYEGDVVYRETIGVPLLVRWNSKNYRFDLTQTPEDLDASFVWFDSTYEVIGNIYENPELLKAVK